MLKAKITLVTLLSLTFYKIQGAIDNLQNQPIPSEKAWLFTQSSYIVLLHPQGKQGEKGKRVGASRIIFHKLKHDY